MKLEWGLLVLVIAGQPVFAAQQPKRIRLHERRPIANLQTVRAIALAGAVREIDVGLIGDRAAMAAAFIGLQRHEILRAASCDHRSRDMAAARAAVAPKKPTRIS